MIPDYINGWPVTTIGANAFEQSSVTSIGGAGNVVTVENFAFSYCESLASMSLPQAQTVGTYAFYSCTSLASMSLPQAQTVGDSAFAWCISLASVPLPQAQTVGNGAFGSCTSLASMSLPQAQTVGNGAFAYCGVLTSLYFDNDAPTIGADIFAELAPNQVTVYVTNPQATGWGAEWGDMPVVRLPLYADAITLGGVERTDWPEEADLTTPYTQWTAQVPVIDGTATVAIAHGNMPYLVCTNATVMTLDPTGYSTGGVSRVSLSVYTGGRTFTLATNVITYVTAPTISTNDWNTVLIRRVGNGTWKGVGL